MRLKGKTISEVELNKFTASCSRSSTNPVITFTDGSAISFRVEETDDGYGIKILYYARKPVKELIVL